MENINIYNKTSLIRLLLAGLFILLVASLSAQVAGDYKTKWGYGSCTDPAAWSYYNGTAWINATQTPPSPFPEGNTIYLDHLIYCNQNMVLAGKIVMSGAGALNVRKDAHLQIASTGVVQNKYIQIGLGATLTNNGQIYSAFPGATIELVAGNAAQNLQAILINNGGIELTDDGNASTYNFIMGGESILRLEPAGYIYGTGTIKTAQWDADLIEIAGPVGFHPVNGAIRLTGTHSIGHVDYVFNGGGPQHAGTSFPKQTFSVTIDNNSQLTLDANLSVRAQGGWVTVKTGSSLDMGLFVMDSGAHYQSSIFTLEPGATLITKHAEGFYSQPSSPGSVRTMKGCILLNNTSYSSGANYWYNGDGNQNSGVFTTEPDPNTVNALTVGKDTNLTWENGGDLPNVNGTYTKLGDETVPVTLSSFTAMVVGLNNVRISWVTASETNCLGYNIWRADSADLTQATRISSLIQAANSSQGAYYVFTDTGLYQEGTYYYWLEDISISYESQFHGHIHLTLEFQGDTQTPEIVERTGFRSNYPNPFNPSTTLRYGLSQDSDVTINFYNLRGQVIDTKHFSNQTKGVHSMVWNTRSLGIPSGVYFARLTSKGDSDLLKITLSE